MLRDIKIAARGLMSSKGFALSASVTLAIGIAATTTIFSVVYGMLLRPLPYRDAGRLVVIQGEKDFSTGPRIMNYSAAELEEFTAAMSQFSSTALSTIASLVFKSEAGVRPVGTATVSGAFFATLDAPPQVGRLFGDEADPVVVISDRFWRAAFGADSHVAGRALRLTDRENIERTYTIVGVMPAEFQYPRPQIDVWRPLAFVRAMGDDRIRERNRGGAEFIARMRDGVALAGARADAARANEILKPQFTNSRLDLRAKVTPLPDYISGTIGPALWILMGAVMLVLLVAATNVASLILARQSSRAKEISVRLALGSPRRRLVRYLVAESVLIAAAGCAIGVATTMGAVRLLQDIKPAQLPRLDSIAVDTPVLAFAAAVASLAAIAAALYPALMATRSDALLAIRAGNAGVVRGSTRLRSTLVVVEIAASMILLVGATLLSRSLFEMLRSDLGVNTGNVMTAQVDIGLGRPMPGPRQIEMMKGLRRRLAEIPSVRIAGFGGGLPRQPLTGWVSDSVAQPRFRSWLLSAIAMITLALAIVGLYSVIAYSASQRTSEIGVRMAIGAQAADIMRLVLADGVKLAVVGIVIGLMGSFWLTGLLNLFLYGVNATDPASFAAAGGVLFVVALIATYLPARRAARIDPMTALRTE